MVDPAATAVKLASRARGGDTAALNELLAELRPLIVHVTRLIAGSGSSAAEDAAQEALLDITKGISSLRDTSAVRTWALRVATRRAIRISRRERLVRLLHDPRESTVAGIAHAPDDERQGVLKQAFDSLPPRLRATAVLRLHAGLSEEETSRVLGCSVGTVKSNLHDARARLTRLLLDAGYAPSVDQRGGPK